MKKLRFITLSLLVVFMFGSCQNGANNKKAKSITGAGATFPQPFYNKIFKTYTKEKSLLVTYGGIGSGGGIRSLKDMIVDFGASDAFLTDSKLKEMPSDILHIPTCLGAVVAAYNIPNKPELKFTPSLLEGIFMGEIKNWNDQRIKEVNPDISLPDLKITVVYRSDGSGTTFIFSDYMNKVSSKWKERVGKGKALKWPVGIGAKGNPGVAGTISQTEGAIGYIGSEYAFSQGISFASIQNSVGNFIKPSIESVSASASGVLANDTRVSLTNTDAEMGYPISSFTWILVYAEQYYNDRSKDQAKQTKNLLDWIIGEEAQKQTIKVHYAPLPQIAREKAKAILSKITYKGEKL
ncbi:MAG: phosphate ABC transporter substrate-binding protein PstS [Marinifilaceae bacterium]|jgi:phosphate transport system substrate-binding protein|nr:phosphate ABC transporter substrate-binding protein PstS [Marinifilaceae bacterium]